MSWADRLEKIISETPFTTEVSKVSKATKPTFRYFRHSDIEGISSQSLSSFHRHNDGGSIPETYGVPLSELQELAGDDWQVLENDHGQLECFAHAVMTRRMRESGLRPPHYIQRSECDRCGPVWLWQGAPDNVSGCPWCFNRINNLMIPRPHHSAQKQKR